MNNGIILSSIAIGVLVSVVLALWILKKWRYIKAAETAQRNQDQIKKQKRKEVIESIKIIALCIIEEQVDLSEGSIRIKVLLDHIAPILHDQAPFNVFSIMYDATEHMPTHGARKRADKALIRKLDAERFELEKNHKDAIIEASKALRDYSFQ